MVRQHPKSPSSTTKRSANTRLTRDSLTSHINLISHSLTQANDALNAHRDFFRAAHAYPLTSFPGHREEDLLGQLLRKKLEPRTEDWIAEYSKEQDGDGVADKSVLSTAHVKELWSWAGPTSNNIVKEMVEEGAFEDDFTLEEREEGVEKVVTGLRRKLYDDSDSDEESGEGDKMEDVRATKAEDGKGEDGSKPPLALEAVLKFMSTGVPPT